MAPNKAFETEDLDVLELAVSTAWATICAATPSRDEAKDELNKARLRQLVFVVAEPGKVNGEELSQTLTMLATDLDLAPNNDLGLDPNDDQAADGAQLPSAR
jgi:hypothetical protein